MSLRWPAVMAWAAAAAAALALFAADLPAEWKNWGRYRQVEIPALDEESLVRFAVPEEVFREASKDLDDLRVIDERGEDVGYVVFERGDGPRTEWRPTELSDIGFVPGSHTQLVADTGDEPALHNAVEATLPPGETELFTWVEVAASPDGETWRVVRTRAPLYRFRQRGFGRAVTISYPRTRDRWLRLRLLRPEDEVVVERLRVAERVEEDEDLQPVKRTLTRRSDSPAGESWWEPAGETALAPIAAVAVATGQSSFHRPVAVDASDDGKQWRQVGAGNIYRYEPDAGERESPGAAGRQSLQVDISPTAAPFWRVTVLDRDDPPIPDLAVSLMRSRSFVVFRATPTDSYRLAYGNPQAEAPEYELGALVSRDDLAHALLVELGPERANEEWVSGEPFTERHPVLLWLALGLVVLVLGSLALRTLRG